MTLSRKFFLPGVFVFPEEMPPYIARLLYEISDRAFSISAGSADQNKEVKSMENETIMIDGVRYYADRPTSCRGCFFWKNRKAGCSLKKENCYYLAESPKKKSPCDGCCYGPCVSFCMKKCMNEVFKTKMEVPVNA